MTPLWIAIALTALPALGFLLAPLWRARPLFDTQRRFEQQDSSDAQNVAIFERRLESLERARARGEIDAARFAEDRLELERSLLEDTAAAPRRALKAPSAGRLLVPVVMVLALAACLLGYQRNGAEGDLALYAINQDMLGTPAPDIEAYRARIEQEAERQPGNPNVWGALFSLYRQAGELDLADAALTRLIEIEGRSPALLAELAELRFFQAGRRLTPAVQALVDEAQAKDPRQPKVLSLLGIHAFDEGDFELAIDRWRRALASLEDEATIEALREGIRTAQARLEGRDE
ncbi:c-type cytochrome biogenesis protein CcmI [Vreelandella malpeensis]|uniref:C-type cytochrome biogenesis protein CcmI n=1 Tax=Vreelandella malpeensis TaxID=1172368 RepID=A0ABS8DRR7_9GAMM|nr:c-type cytochrome biogenesis protein CcmI [Halomonas malpeensis]MCB8888919.1 c-type cytochrome biogenesis protein CcmI [Halomonas malpeensis]